MKSNLLMVALFAAPIVLAAEKTAEKEDALLPEGWAFHGMLWNLIESGYVSSSGTLSDTKPISMQDLDYDFTMGDYGHIWGYGCFLGTLHDEQHEFHRAAFNEFETGAFYGYDVEIADDVIFCNSGGMIVNPLIGYRSYCDDTGWWYRYFESLENPVITPFWDILGGFKPAQWNRIRFGVRRSFTFMDKFILTPMIDSVWNDSSRFKRNFHTPIDSGKFLNGAFQSITATLKLEWKIDENWSTWVAVKEYILVDSQARHEMDNNPNYTQYYWTQTEATIFSWGVGYSF